MTSLELRLSADAQAATNSQGHTERQDASMRRLGSCRKMLTTSLTLLVLPTSVSRPLSARKGMRDGYVGGNVLVRVPGISAMGGLG